MARPPKLGVLDPSATIFESAEGWQGFITVGTKPNGLPDRRKRRGKDEPEVRRKLLALQAEMSKGRVAAPGVKPLLETFLLEWLEDPDATRRYNTNHNNYGWAVRKWIIPGLGKWRIDVLPAKVIEDFLRGLARKEAAHTGPGKPEGLGPSSVHSVFRTLRAALNDAVRRGHMGYNPMELMTWRPKLDEEEVTPLFVSEVKAILEVCKHRRNGTRWSIGLPIGLRQGEALGLPWMKPSKSVRDKPIGLDPTTGRLDIRRQSERRKWQHGCENPVECARPHCRTSPCPPRWQHGCGKRPEECTKQRVDRCPRRKPRPGCATHRDPKSCTKLCPANCTDHASTCKKRHSGGIVFTDTKSAAGHRHWMLAPPMIKLAKAHKKDQDRERALAGDEWHDFGLVWCQPNGKPIDARADWEDWKEILRLAGVRDARVHDGRHTAATMLLLQGVDEQTVMALMGWSDRRMLGRYQHVLDELRAEASARIGALLWDEPTPAKAKKPKKTDKPKKNKKSKNPDIDGTRFATSAATSGPDAKIIPFPTSA